MPGFVVFDIASLLFDLRSFSKQGRVVIGKKEEREPHDLTVWFPGFCRESG
jgi:hypothetical protein